MNFIIKNSNSLVKYTVILVLLQVLVFNNFKVFDFAVPYVYILYIYWLPLKSNASQIAASFLIGLFVDLFLDSQGVHATACVLICFLRPVFLRLFFGYSYLNKSATPPLARQKRLYLVFLIFFHTFLIYNFEFFNLNRILIVTKYTIFSSTFTLILCFMINPFFKKI